MLRNLSKTAKYAILGGIALVVLMLILTFTLFIPQGVQSDGNKKEANLSATYAQGLADLHNCVVKTARAAQVSVANSDSLDKILKDAVGGRYGSGLQLDKHALISAIVEAYPNLSGVTSSFNNALAVMTGCQDDFAADQKLVQDEVSNFKSWKTGSYWTRNFGGGDFPNSNLTLRVDNTTYSGQRAFELISQPIVDVDTVNALQSGQDNSYQNNPYATPSPTHS